MLLIIILLCNGCSPVENTWNFVWQEINELIGEDYEREEGASSPDEFSSEKVKSEDISEQETELVEESFQEEINDYPTLCRFVSSQLEEGKTEISFYTSDISEAMLQELNSHMDGFYGSVYQYSMKKELFTGRTYCVLNSTITDNTYVEQYFRSQKMIPESKKKAQKLAESCEKILEQMESELPKDASNYRKERWIHDYLISHIAYGFHEEEGPKGDLSYDSYGALVNGKAVCNGYAYAMKLLCDLTDIPCNVVVGSGHKENHAWNMVSLNGNWYHVDVTWDDPTPDQDDRIFYTYFNVTDEKLSMNHDWERQAYPVADATEYNYYIRNELYCKNYDAFKEKCIEIMDDTGDVRSFQLMVGDYDPTLYSEDNLDFLFRYTDYRSMNYQIVGDIPYASLYLSFQ